MADYSLVQCIANVKNLLGNDSGRKSNWKIPLFDVCDVVLVLDEIPEVSGATRLNRNVSIKIDEEKLKQAIINQLAQLKEKPTEILEEQVREEIIRPIEFNVTISEVI